MIGKHWDFGTIGRIAARSAAAKIRNGQSRRTAPQKNREWEIAARSAAKKIGKLTIVHGHFVIILAAKIKSFIAIYKLYISAPDLQLITSINAIYKCTE